MQNILTETIIKLITYNIVIVGSISTEILPLLSDAAINFSNTHSQLCKV